MEDPVIHNQIFPVFIIYAAISLFIISKLKGRGNTYFSRFFQNIAFISPEFVYSELRVILPINCQTDFILR